ncbi:hypothetical protein [Methanobrevibacter sp.]
MSDNKKLLILPIILLVLLTIGMVSASDNITDDNIALEEESSTQAIAEAPANEEIESTVNESSHVTVDNPIIVGTKIETKNVYAYYKEKSELVSYLKDANNRPVSNKKVSVSINNKIYDKITDNSGKIVLKLNLKPGNYKATVKFHGDDNFTASFANAMVNVKKSTLSISAKNYKTYFESGFFFKAKVINKITKNPVKNVKVAFKVYNSNNKYRIYYGTTDTNGIAKLKKNFKVGSYKVIVQIKNGKYLKAKKTKATLTIKETAEMGCTSLYVQVSNNEAVVGFRRDTTNARNIHIVKYKLNGIPVVKQYKKNSYFFHTIAAANGWMAGTGGADNPNINHAIEKLVGKMFKEGKIKKSYLKKIQGYERQLGIGHFSIKAPNGKYAVVWSSGIKYGKLKPGEYLKAPNSRSLFRHGTYAQFDKNPSKAAIKIAASDSFGVNRRDATAFHWKTATKEGKTTASVKVYAANDNGRLVGRSTGHLKDNIYFKGKFISKNSLPKTPSSKYLGTIKLGNIDKLIKTKTIVKAPKININRTQNESKPFKVTVKDKTTNKAIKNLAVKVKIGDKVYSIKTNKKGVAQLKTTSLSVGTHKVMVYTDNIKYLVSASSKIIIKE